MADQVKQLAFRKFTVTELQNGTAANVLTTDSSTHYVIKSIEATQENNSNAITATATIGLTSGVSSGDYVSLGTVAKQDRIGLSGNAIMDASSTLTIRPVAKSIAFGDEEIQYAFESSNQPNPRKFRKIVTPSVNNTVESGLVTRTTIDKTSVSFGGNSYTINNYPNNHMFIYTRSDGVNLRVLIHNHTSNGSGYEVFNADDGTYYGYFSTNYVQSHWDGGRYIYCFNPSNRSQLLYYDLEETLTNLAAANTYGGSNGSSFYHGLISIGTGSDAIPNYSPSTWDNRRSAFFLDTTNSKKFISQFFANNSIFAMVEIPIETHTNYNATANVTTKWVMAASSTNDSSGTDPFGANSGQTRSLGHAISNYLGSNNTNIRMTWDNELKRYFFYPSSGDDTYVATFTLDEYNATQNATKIDQGSNGLYTVSQPSAATLGFGSWFQNDGNQNGKIDLGNLGGSAGSSFSFTSSSERFYDGRKIVVVSNTSPQHLYKVSLLTAGLEKLTTNMTDTEVSYNTYESFWYGHSVPSSSVVSGRAYTQVPGLKIRVAGVLSDQ